MICYPACSVSVTGDFSVTSPVLDLRVLDGFSTVDLKDDRSTCQTSSRQSTLVRVHVALLTVSELNLFYSLKHHVEFKRYVVKLRSKKDLASVRHY